MFLELLFEVFRLKWIIFIVKLVSVKVKLIVLVLGRGPAVKDSGDWNCLGFTEIWVVWFWVNGLCAEPHVSVVNGCRLLEQEVL